MACKPVVSLQMPSVPAAVPQDGELPTLLQARARKEHPWNRKRFSKANSLQISLPEPDQLEAYPAEAVRVQNTFIHVASPTPESLERVAQSCPSRHIGSLKDAFKEDHTTSLEPKQVLCLEEVLFEPSMPSTPEPLQMGMNFPSCYGYQMTPEKLRRHPLGSEIAEWQPAPGMEGLHGPPPMPGNWPLPSQQLGAYPQQIPPHLAALPPQPLGNVMPPVMPEVNMTEYMLPMPSEPAPGSAELPSVGSKGHGSGECKPCAFLHVKGCDNGAMCKFCHLCDAGEKKRRQKAKKAAFRGGA